jgi:hypothetical protein
MTNKININTKVVIKKDYNSNLSYDIRNQNIGYLLTELDLYCEIKNNSFVNIIKELQATNAYNNNYTDKLIINAVGYSQSDWQEYTLHYNKDEINKAYLKQLIKLLKKSFTHLNDYIAYVNELVTVDNKTYSSVNTECFGFCVNQTEFPESESIIKEFNEQFGIKYDTIEYIIS